MNLYLDTSALVKLYVTEAGSNAVAEAVTQALLVATSMIAYVEAVAAFTRKVRSRDLDRRGYRRAMRDLENGWPRVAKVEVTGELVRQAADHASRRGLRAYDAIHLASAIWLGERLHDTMVFACWDRELASAAARSGLPLLA